MKIHNKKESLFNSSIVKAEPLSHTTHNNNSKLIGLAVQPETIKYSLGENSPQHCLCGFISYSKGKKNNSWNYIKLKSFCTEKETVIKTY